MKASGHRRDFDQDLCHWQEEQDDVLLMMIDLDGFIDTGVTLSLESEW